MTRAWRHFSNFTWTRLGCILLASAWLATTPVSGLSASQRDKIQQLFTAGEQALAEHKNSQAAAAFRQVIRLDRSNAGAFANLGVAEMRKEHWREALADLERARALAPGVSGIGLNIGLVYYLQGKYDEAIPAFVPVVAANPTVAQPRYLLGLCYFYARKYPQALRELEPLWAQESANLGYLYVLSVAADESGEHSLETKAAARLLQVGAGSPEMHLLLGKAHLVREENESALSELLEAAHGNPGVPYVHFYLGIADRRLNKFAAAKAQFLQDLAQHPDSGSTLDELGAVSSDLQQRIDAARYYREALRINPALASSYYGLAKIELKSKQLSLALQDLDHAGRIDPKSASVHYLRARIFQAMGRKRAAAAEFATAAAMQRAVEDRLQQEISGKTLPSPDAASQNP